MYKYFKFYWRINSSLTWKWPTFLTAAEAEARKAAMSPMSGTSLSWISGLEQKVSFLMVKSTGPSVSASADLWDEHLSLASVSSSLIEWTSSWTESSGFCSSNFDGRRHLRRFFKKWNLGEVFLFELPDCWLDGLVSGSTLDSRLSSDSSPRIRSWPAQRNTASRWSWATYNILIQYLTEIWLIHEIIYVRLADFPRT